MNKTTQLDRPVRIGELAGRAGCSVPTIRYYEVEGLLPRARRSLSGHRIYDPKLAGRLRFIRRWRDFGFSIEELRALLSLSDDNGRDCGVVRNIAAANLTALRSRMLDMMAAERALARYVEECGSTCAGGPVPKCNIFSELAADPAAPNSACCA